MTDIKKFHKTRIQGVDSDDHGAIHFESSHGGQPSSGLVSHLNESSQDIMAGISSPQFMNIVTKTQTLKKKSQIQTEDFKIKKVKLIITTRQEELERQQYLQQNREQRASLENKAKRKKIKSVKAIKTKNVPADEDFNAFNFLEEVEKSNGVETETVPNPWPEQLITPNHKDEIKDEPEIPKISTKLRPSRKSKPKEDETEIAADPEDDTEPADDSNEDYNPDQYHDEGESEIEEEDAIEGMKSDAYTDDEDNRPLRSRRIRSRRKLYETCLSDPTESELSMTPENIAKFGGEPKGESLIKFRDEKLSAVYLDQYVLFKSKPEEPLQNGAEKEEEEQEDCNKVFGCPFCDFSGMKNNWLGHLKLRHKDKNLIYCALGQNCYMPFQQKDLLKNHVDAEHLESENSCPTCGKLFKWPSSLRNHMQSHLKEGDQKKQMFICPFCGKKFNTRTGFRSHEAIYHTKNLRHKCDWPGCDKKFYNASDLVIHKRTHTGELPYTCSYCGSGFVSKSRMMQHERQMHLGVEKADVECEICHHKMRGRNYTFHMKTHKGLTKAWCGVCGKEFPTQGAKRRHEKIHFQDKKHACKFCGKAFVQRSNMVSHERIHTGEKPFPCKWCEERFVQQTRRNQHQNGCRLRQQSGSETGALFDTFQTTATLPNTSL